MKPTVFIQANAKQLVGARVAAYALRRNSRLPDGFGIRILRVEDYPALYGRDGQRYLRRGTAVVWKNDDLQSFTPTRFLAPQLSNFEGRALVIDPDVFALADVMELLTMDMREKAILCRPITSKDGQLIYWASSVMLLECSRLRHWQWEQCIEEMFTFKRDYRDWMSLLLEPQNEIGVLDDCWNQFDRLDEGTKMLHNTQRLTQPWKTGLPLDFIVDRPNAASDWKWGIIPRPWISRAKAILNGRPYHPRGSYQRHPDQRQERLFFSLLKECVDGGEITLQELEFEIGHKRIRSDTLRLLADAKVAAAT